MNNTFYGSNDYRSYLEHHGVLGMKWGRRKARENSIRTVRRNNDYAYTSYKSQRKQLRNNYLKSNRGISDKKAYRSAKKSAHEVYANRVYSNSAKIKYGDIAKQTALMATVGGGLTVVGNILSKKGKVFAGAGMQGLGIGLVEGAAISGVTNSALTYGSRKIQKKNRLIDQDIRNLSQYKNTGISTKKGKTVLTPADINDSINRLNKKRR